MHFLNNFCSSGYANKAVGHEKNQDFEQASSNYRSAAHYYNDFVEKESMELDEQEAIAIKHKVQARKMHVWVIPPAYFLAHKKVLSLLTWIHMSKRAHSLIGCQI